MKSRGRLIEVSTDLLPARVFDDPNCVAYLKNETQGSPGIYALYADGALYYVGLGKNVVSRLKSHRKDGHKRKWNQFRLFKIKNEGHLKDMETLLLQISKPTGNIQSGRLPKDARAKQRKLTQAIQKLMKTSSTI